MNEHLKRMLRRLPSWAQMRYDPNRPGHALMDALSMGVEAAMAELQYVADNRHLGSAHPNQVAWVYMTAVEPPRDGEQMAVIGAGFTLERVPDLASFLRAWDTDPLHETSLFYENPYFYDEQTHRLYVRKPYGQSDEHPYGQIQVIYQSPQGQRSATYELQLHHVWNAFDEFALMAGLRRWPEESNESLRERIWDRFRLPRHMGPVGIESRIAQAIGAIREIKWYDPSTPLIIPEPYVRPELVLVDGIPLEEGAYTIDTADRVVLLPREQPGPIPVRYVVGLRVRQTTPEDAERFYQDILSATPAWGRMRYDSAFWLPEDMPAARLPVCYDADPMVWRQIGVS